MFFGPAGEVGAVAASLGDYLWLLTGGIGPMEAVHSGADDGVPHDALRMVAEAHSSIEPRTPAKVLAATRAEFPYFVATVASWCRLTWCTSGSTYSVPPASRAPPRAANRSMPGRGTEGRPQQTHRLWRGGEKADIDQSMASAIGSFLFSTLYADFP